MAKGFWINLPTPFFTLAPMADVTDAAFRQIIAKYGKPDILFTEFVSCDGLCSAGKDALLRELYFTDAERPIVAQLFTARPEKMEQCAKIVRGLGFDGIDINMGCPDRSVEKQGAGAALIRDPERAKALIAAAKKGAGEMPVSLKTRIGYNTNEIEEWTRALLDAKPAAITFHLRTRKEMSKTPAHWDQARVPIAMARGSGTLIIGNGDVENMEDARRKAAEHGTDGVMLGRAIFGNPWLFSGRGEIPFYERLFVMVEHARLFERLFGNTETNKKLFGGRQKNFLLMRKHMGAYIKGFRGAAALRARLMGASNAQDVEKAAREFLRGAAGSGGD